jgi:hypothetical protein
MRIEDSEKSWALKIPLSNTEQIHREGVYMHCLNVLQILLDQFSDNLSTLYTVLNFAFGNPDPLPEHRSKRSENWIYTGNFVVL